MKILFCYPNIDTRTKPEIHLGIGYMAALLGRAGHRISLYWPQRLSRKGFEEALRAASPDLVAFSLTSYQYSLGLRLAAWSRQCSRAPVLFGGIHPTIAPEDVIREGCVDMLCRGEGENAVMELAGRIDRGESDFRGIPNLWVKGAGGAVERTPPGPLIRDLDALPFPDRELFGIRALLAANGGRHEVLSGRGCPFECTYCCNRVLREFNRGCGPYVRKRSVDNVLAEIRFLRERYPMSSILFHDDTFTLNRPWLLDFCARYGREFHVPFHCLARVETIDAESASALRDAGCRAVSLGVESGSERIRREVLQRDIDDQQIRDAFRVLRAHGIQRFSFNMIGLPGETPEDVDRTIALNREIDPDWMGVLVFTPYPGTVLHRLCEEKGYLRSRGFPTNYLTERSSTLSLPTLPRRQFLRKYRELQTMAYGKYVKAYYPRLYPLFVLVRPLLRTPIHNWASAIAFRLLYKK